MHKSGVCYIFGAGEAHGTPPHLMPGDCVIAADGGYALATAWGIPVDLVIGDFDSLPGGPPEGIPAVVLSPVKDDTDMLTALMAGEAQGFRTFHIYGGTGGRLDHTLANIQCLCGLAMRGGRGFLYGRDTIITAIHGGKMAFAAGAQGTVSVFAHTDQATGVYLQGLAYPLTDATLKNDYPLGVSNAFTGQAASISVGVGTLVVIYPASAADYLLL